MTNQANEQATESSLSLQQRLQQTRDRRVSDTLLGAVLLAVRPDLTLALTLPALVGSFIGGWWVGAFDWMRFIFGVGGVLIAAVAFQVLMAYQDFEQSLRADTRPATDAPESTFTLQQHGVLPPAMLLNLGALLYTGSVLCGLWLALLAGWPILFFGGLALLLQLAALFPPVRFAYRGYGFGEVGVLLIFGILPLFSSFYAQTQQLNWLPVVGGLPIALLALLVVMCQNLVTLRRDWLIGKRTLAVILGDARTIDLHALVTMVAYTSILVITVLTPLPLWYLAGLATLPLAMGAFAQIDRQHVTPENAARLRGVTTKALFWTSLLVIAALLISRPG